MKKLAIIYFFAFWLFNLLDDLVYWKTHGQAVIPTETTAWIVIIMWIGGTILIWNSKDYFKE